MPYMSKLTKRLAMGRLPVAIIALLSSCMEPVAVETEEPGTPGQPTVVDVRVSPESTETFPGRTLRLVAEARDSNGRAIPNETITWRSSDTTVATVDSDGDVLTLRTGTADIIAGARGNKWGKSKINVVAIAVASVAVTPSSASIQVAQQVDLDATTRSASDSVLTGRALSWASSNSAVATVDANGLVTGVAVGSATINATSEGRTGSAALTVSAAPPPPLPGTVSTLTVTATSDTTATLRFTEVTDGLGDAADYLVRFSLPPMTWDAAFNIPAGTCTPPVFGTTAGAVRTCVVRGLTAGTSYRFQVMSFRGTLGVDPVYGSVSNIASGTTATAPPAPVATVALTPISDTATVGQTAAYAATLRDATGNVLTGRAVTWSSTNTGVATVSSTGVTTAVAAGTTSIRATSEGVTGTATLLVTAPPVIPVATVTLSPANDTANVGQTATYTATLRDATGAVLTGRTVTWSSTNTAVATVNASGVATGVAAGTATVRATSGGITGNATLLVVAPAPAPVATVTIAPTSATTTVGQGATFTATLRDAAGNTLTGRTVTWGSSATGIATVSTSGLALGVAVGSTTITATSEGRSGTASLTVNVAPPPGSLVFSSNWSAATGNSTNAMSDGGKWQDIYCGSAGQTLNVVAGSTVGWTKTPNVLRLQQLGESICGMLERVDVVPASTSHWGRLYFRNDEVGTTHNHIVAYNPVGDIQATIFGFRGTSGGAEVILKTLKGASYPNDIWTMKGAPNTSAARVPNARWYRYEWHMEYMSATTYRIHPRLYDLAGTLISDENTTYRNDSNGSASHTLAAYYAAGGTFACSTSLCRRAGLGQEGPAGSQNTGGYWYHADFAISLTGWIGQ